MDTKRRVEICFSPAEYKLYQESFQLIVVIDVFAGDLCHLHCTRKWG